MLQSPSTAISSTILFYKLTVSSFSIASSLFTVAFSSGKKYIYLISPILKHSSLALCTLIMLTPLFHSQTSYRGCYRLALSIPLLSNSEIFLSPSLELELCTYQILHSLTEYMQMSPIFDLQMRKLRLREDKGPAKEASLP